MKILVCGGRNYNDIKRVYEVLDRLNVEKTITCVIHGAASGADTLAKRWGEQNKKQVLSYPAQWAVHGRAAGPKRNIQMLTEHPDVGIVISFPGGVGTQHMTDYAESKGFKILKVD